MKKKFIVTFLEVLIDLLGEAPETIGAIFTRESLQMKIMRSGGYDPKKFRNGFHNLKQRGLISMSEGGYKLSLQGRKWYAGVVHRYFRERYRAWDQKWRIVIFDIPQELHRQRNLFRRKLLAMGCRLLQKSIFVFPYPCEEEIAQFCKPLKIGKYVDVLIAESIGSREGEMRSYYNL